jgi:N-acetylglucosamine-6-phosphate deacetylase
MGMDHMVRQMKRDTSANLPEVIRMASLTPAELTGIARRTGSIAVGKQADLLLLSRRLTVKQVFIGGSELSISR